MKTNTEILGGEMTVLEELAGMKLLNKDMRELFIELYIKGKDGKLKNLNLESQSNQRNK